jgi:enoyl-CoA hydratase
MPFPLLPLEIVRYALGHDRAQRAVLAGIMVGPDGAIAAGMADELADPAGLLPRALEMAASMAAGSPASFARTKAALRRPVIERWERLREADDAETLAAWDSPEARAAIRSYVERTLDRSRTPQRST